jgi:hypothetical protein
MALTNCKKISDVSITVAKDQALGTGTDATMFIDPIDLNYVVAASNFQNNTITANVSSYINTSNNNSGFVNGIKLTDTTSANSSDNRIRVDIDLLDTFSPSANIELEIDIDGSATHVDDIQYTVAGEYDVRRRNEMQNSGSDLNNVYSVSGKVGETKTILTEVFQATSGNFLSSEPSYELENVDSNENNYTLKAINRQYDSEERLIAVTFKVEYTFTAESFSGHQINLTAYGEAPIEQIKLINGYEIKKTKIISVGEYRNFTIYGVPGSSFIFSITDENSDTYNFNDDTFSTPASNLTGLIPDSGKYVREDIYFPPTDSSVKYSFSLQGGSSPATLTSEGGASNNNPFEWEIFSTDNISLVIEADTLNVASMITSIDYTNNTIGVEVGADDFTDGGGVAVDVKDFSIVINGNKNLFIKRQPFYKPDEAYSATENDFTNAESASNGGMIWQINDLQATGAGTTTLTISGKLGIETVGTLDVISSLFLRKIINTAPVATPATFSCANGATRMLSFNGTDVDFATQYLAFVITSLPSNGDLYETDDTSLSTPITNSDLPYSITSGNKNQMLYKHDATATTTDSFQFKANDGVEDSVAAATYSGTIAVGNAIPVANTQTLDINEFGIKAFQLTGSDSDATDDIFFVVDSLPTKGALFLPTMSNGVPYQPYLDNPNDRYSFTGSGNEIRSVDLPKTLPVSHLGYLVYRHRDGVGTDSFNFYVTDTKDNSSTVAVNFNINEAPSGTKTAETLELYERKTITLTSDDPEDGVNHAGSKFTITRFADTQMAWKYKMFLPGSNSYLRYWNFPLELPNNQIDVQHIDDGYLASSFQYTVTDQQGAVGPKQTVNLTVNPGNNLGSVYFRRYSEYPTASNTWIMSDNNRSQTNLPADSDNLIEEDFHPVSNRYLSVANGVLTASGASYVNRLAEFGRIWVFDNPVTLNFRIGFLLPTEGRISGIRFRVYSDIDDPLDPIPTGVNTQVGSISFYTTDSNEKITSASDPIYGTPDDYTTLDANTPADSVTPQTILQPGAYYFELRLDYVTTRTGSGSGTYGGGIGYVVFQKGKDPDRT